MPDRRPKTRIQQKNSEAILEAALEVFSQAGFRGATLDQIAEAVGQFGVAAIDDRLGRIAAVLPEGDFAHQEVPQRIHSEPLCKFKRVGDVAERL